MTTSRAIVEPVVKLLDEAKASTSSPIEGLNFGPQLPPMKPDDDLQHFRRVLIRDPLEPIHDVDTARAILRTNPMDAAANTSLALRLIEDGQKGETTASLDMAIRHLEIAISSGT